MQLLHELVLLKSVGKAQQHFQVCLPVLQLRYTPCLARFQAVGAVTIMLVHLHRAVHLPTVQW